jgi:hypothetical protein
MNDELNRGLAALSIFLLAEWAQRQEWCDVGCQNIFGAVASNAQKTAISSGVALAIYAMTAPKPRRTYRRLR